MILHFDCSTGASGDKILGALLELSEALGKPAWQQLEAVVQALVPSAVLKRHRLKRGGIAATGIEVSEQPAPRHRHWSDIRALIAQASNDGALPQPAAFLATTCFERLAQAEAVAHDVDVDNVHFHEVGAADSIVDIVGSCLLLEALSPRAVYATPVALGTGSVECAHGRLPVPAPATLRLLMTQEGDSATTQNANQNAPTNMTVDRTLQGGQQNVQANNTYQTIPVYASVHTGELTTPTGAALIRSFVSDFAPLPCSVFLACGYGAGSRELDGTSNVLRILAAKKASWVTGARVANNTPAASDPGGKQDDFLVEGVACLETNVDHRSPEALAFICDQLLKQGALDVWQEAIQMKKGRLALKLCLLCAPERASEFAAALIRQSGSLGVRMNYGERTVAPRHILTLDTPYGPVPFKAAPTAPPADRPFLIRPEHDAVAHLATCLNQDYQALYDKLVEFSHKIPASHI
ncbi:MAG: LarC family nickel insertion protein [Coriobacteriales bacterium]|nr:LarC family nickel insertion protein [Coriobacteriales bacterium]